MEPVVFQQADVLHHICGFLSAGSLPKLARVSRALHYSILPYIWNKLNQRTIACLTREIGLTAQLAGHFKLHASLVQDLTLDFFHERRYRVPLLAALDDISAYAPPTEPVLPNLRRFRICASEAIDLTYANYFLGPSVYELDVGCGGFNNQLHHDDYSAKVVTELLVAIQKRCTSLHTISFKGMPWLRDLPEMNTLLGRLPNITTYHGDGVALSPKILGALSRSTDIVHLKMHMLPSQYDVFNAWGDLPLDGVYTDTAPLLRGIHESISSDGFFSLRELDLNCNVVVASALLQKIRSNLQSITVVCSNRRGLILQDELDGLIQDITTFSTSLYDVNLTFIEPFDPLVRRDRPVSWQTFAPLLQCREIQRFSLMYDTSDDFDFSQSHLSDITRAWRNLESFILDWDPPSRHRTKSVNHIGLHDPRSLDLVSLLRFAFECPRLRRLLVAWLDASGSLEVPADMPIIAWPLTLGVGYGQMECAPSVAGFLRKVRPNVQVECRSSYGPETPRRAWKKVQELLKAPATS